MTAQDRAEELLSKWKFFHVRRVWGSLGDILAANLTLEEVLVGHICPYLTGDPYPTGGGATKQGAIVNPRGFMAVIVYGTNQPVDKTWPPLKSGGRSDVDVANYLEENGHNVSSAVYRVAAIFIETGAYKDARKQILESMTPNFVFMITVIGDSEVDGVYTSAVKPSLESNGLTVARSDEIRRAGLVMASVTEAIAASKFVVADLTNARPNCYYELGYAHALGKTGLLIAKEGSVRHFDVAGYRWNAWKTGVDFRPEFNAEVLGVLRQIAGESVWFPPGTT